MKTASGEEQKEATQRLKLKLNLRERIALNYANNRKTYSAAFIILFILTLFIIFWFAGRPMLKFLSEPEKYRVWVDSRGFTAYAAFVGMMALQVIIAFIPGEPLEIAAGYSFGVLGGTLVCLAGAVVGSAAVYIFVKRVGIKAIEVFFTKEKIQSVKFIKDSKKLNLLVFVLFLIPGSPKDLMTYFIGLTPMKMTTWLLITAVARIPSVITSTIGGNALGVKQYMTVVVAFSAAVVISIAGVLLYRHISRRSS